MPAPPGGRHHPSWRSRSGRSDARTSRGTRPSSRSSPPTDASVPQALQVPAAGPAVLVEIDHGAASSLDAPVLAVAAVLPPPALDPPPADHVADLVPTAPPDEGRGHPRVPLHRDEVLVELCHRLRPHLDRPPPNRTYVRGKGTVRLCQNRCQAG